MLVPSLPHPIPNDTPQYRAARKDLLQKNADTRRMVSELFFTGLDGQPRRTDTIWSSWNTFDMLPHGRGTDWYPAIDYRD